MRPQTSGSPGIAGLIAGLSLLCAAGPAQAVTFTEQIERLQAVYAALLDYRTGGPPQALAAGAVQLGLEVVPIPPIDNRVGNKNEPVNPPPAYGRLRGLVGLGAGFALGAAYLPPIHLQGYTADLWGAGLEYGLRQGDFLAGLRAFTLQGAIRGPITDSSTSDTFTLHNTGGDFRLGWTLDSWILYGGAGSGQSQTRLEVSSDGSVSKVDRVYRYAFGGASWEKGPWRLSLEQQQTESYLRHLVFTVFHEF